MYIWYVRNCIFDTLHLYLYNFFNGPNILSNKQNITFYKTKPFLTTATSLKKKIK